LVGQRLEQLRQFSNSMIGRHLYFAKLFQGQLSNNQLAQLRLPQLMTSGQHLADHQGMHRGRWKKSLANRLSGALPKNVGGGQPNLKNEASRREHSLALLANLYAGCVDSQNLQTDRCEWSGTSYQSSL
ncbi:MAG TPA: hypothetical protein DCF63_14415, partial [Planctomycetaceae bacterium]|nr:hypothetical protein [Planctomycetaceae bacterium]